MGKKRSRIGNELYLCIALLMFLVPLACTVGKTNGVKMVDTTGEEAAMHLALSRQFLAEGNYGRALTESETVLSLAGRDIPMAESLFYIGLIQAHPANPARDDAKAIITFQRLIKDYPQSPQAAQARAIARLIQENEKLNRTVDRLNSQVDRLNGQVEKSSNQMERLNSQVEKSNSQVEKLNSQVEKSGSQMERLNNQMERLNNIIDELKKVDIGVEQKKREKGR